jgi:glycosyltransferase involved in cell wall biosynthesis
MNIKKVFIIVPAPVDDSPIKGAAALANALSEWVSVTFITLKQGNTTFDLLNKNVKWVRLAQYSWYGKIKVLHKLLERAGDKQTVATISSSLSADFVNSLCNKYAITCASVRGNLPANYMDTYGWSGLLIAYIHLKRLKKVDHVVSMTDSMAAQVKNYLSRNSQVIGNFIDEGRLEKYRKKNKSGIVFRFVFTGSFIERKQPLLFIETVANLYKQGVEFVSDMFGDGPLLKISQEKAKELGVDKYIVFHGHINEPYDYITKADVLILPSLSEGVSRSVLEALCLGVPCVLRNVDGNRELIQAGVNGELFNSDEELPDLVLKVAQQSRDGDFYNKNLIPDKFRQNFCAKSYLNLISK